MIVKMDFPPACLFPNRRNGQHWTVTNAAKDDTRERAVEATKQAMRGDWPGVGPIPLSIVFVAPDGRHRDLDNCLAAAKAQIDGIADAMGVNDRRFRPILIDYIKGDKTGAMIVAVGVQIVSSQVIL